MEDIIAICITMVMMVSAMGSLPVGAGLHTARTTTAAQGQAFTKAWKKSVTFTYPMLEDAPDVGAVIGFDTWCTDEDYIKSVNVTSRWGCFGIVQNSLGQTAETNRVGKTKIARSTNKADIRHVGNSVAYFAYLET